MISRRVTWLCVSVLLFLAPAFLAQDRAREPFLFLPAGFTKIGAAAWGAGGAYVAVTGTPTAAFDNPAGLLFDEVHLYADVGQRFHTDYLGGADFAGQLLAPGFIGLGKSFGKLQVAAGYFRFYSFELVAQSYKQSPQLLQNR